MKCAQRWPCFRARSEDRLTFKFQNSLAMAALPQEAARAVQSILDSVPAARKHTFKHADVVWADLHTVAPQLPWLGSLLAFVRRMVPSQLATDVLFPLFSANMPFQGREAEINTALAWARARRDKCLPTSAMTAMTIQSTTSVQGASIGAGAEYEHKEPEPDKSLNAMITMCAAPGCGKSRLGYEILAAIQRNDELSGGTCVGVGHGPNCWRHRSSKYQRGGPRAVLLAVQRCQS